MNAITKTAPAAGNGTHAGRAGTVKISAPVLLKTLPREDVAAHVDPEGKSRGLESARAVFEAVTAYQSAAPETDRDGTVSLCRFYTRDGRMVWTAAGNMLRGFARSALMSAYFEQEAAARAWNRFVEAREKGFHERSMDKRPEADTEGADSTTPELDAIAARAMDAIASAAAVTFFACELARICKDQGDGEEIETSYTPRADADAGKSVTPRAAATLASFLAAK